MSSLSYTNGGVFSTVLFLFFSGCSAPQSALERLVPCPKENTEALTGSSIARFVSILAHDSMEGRASGTTGYDRAARWVVSQLKDFGAKPAGTDFYQEFRIGVQTARTRIHIPPTNEDSLTTANVIGIVEGSDPVLKNEYIVFTAHLDHLGRRGNDIYHGANDNASGCAVVLALAEWLHRQPKKPKRSVVFIFFSGEEAGLLGSAYFVQHPVLPLRSIKLLINLDLVGSGRDGFMIQGYEKYPSEYARVRALSDSCFRYEISTRPNSPNSDQYFFNEAGVPAFFIYAYKGTMPYHQPEDTSDLIDPVVLERTALWMAAILSKF